MLKFAIKNRKIFLLLQLCFEVFTCLYALPVYASNHVIHATQQMQRTQLISDSWNAWKPLSLLFLVGFLFTGYKWYQTHKKVIFLIKEHNSLVEQHASQLALIQVRNKYFKAISAADIAKTAKERMLQPE